MKRMVVKLAFSLEWSLKILSSGGLVMLTVFGPVYRRLVFVVDDDLHGDWFRYATSVTLKLG